MSPSLNVDYSCFSNTLAVPKARSSSKLLRCINSFYRNTLTSSRKSNCYQLALPDIYCNFITKNQRLKMFKVFLWFCCCLGLAARAQFLKKSAWPLRLIGDEAPSAARDSNECGRTVNRCFYPRLNLVAAYPVR